MRKLIVAATIGEPISIGLEICVEALQQKNLCKAEAFTDRRAFSVRRAVALKDRTLESNTVREPLQSVDRFGTIDLLETGTYANESIAYGKVQQLAGHRRYCIIKNSCS